jgi:hypothetical protein
MLREQRGRGAVVARGCGARAVTREQERDAQHCGERDEAPNHFLNLM